VALSVRKILRSFTERPCHPLRAVSIVRAIIASARTLDIKVVAESVESGPQIADKRESKSGYLWGFLHSRPQTTETIRSQVGCNHPMPADLPAFNSAERGLV
jgi:EAL domain-containing protein (putative c-di-GMP-specific phosphodiesterase class I)